MNLDLPRFLRKYPAEAVAVGALLAAITQIWLVEYFPLQDYYGWLYQSRVLAGLLKGEAFAEGGFEIDLFPLPPNILTVAFLSLTGMLTSFDIAGRLFLSLYVLLMAGGSYFLVARMAGRCSPFRFVGLWLLYHAWFYQGFLSFSMGLALCFWIIPWCFVAELPSAKRARRLLGCSLLLYSLHGFAYGLLMLYLLVWLGYEWKIGGRPTGEISSTLAAVFPSAVLLLCYVFFLPATGQNTFAFYDSPWHWVQSLRYAAMPFQRFVLIDNPLPASLLNIVFLGAYSAFLAVDVRRFKAQWPAVVFCLIAAALMLLNPFYRLGNFFPVSPRMMTFLMIFCTVFFVFRPSPPGASRLKDYSIVLTGVIIVASHIVMIGNFQKQGLAAIEGLRPLLAENRSTLILGKIYREDFDRDPGQRFSGIVQPFIRSGFYFQCDSLRDYYAIQETSILRMKDDAPRVRARIAIDSLFDAAATVDDALRTARQNRPRIARQYERIIFFGSPATRDSMTTVLQPKFYRMRRSPLWDIFEKAPVVE